VKKLNEKTYICKNCGYSTGDIDDINKYVYIHGKNGEFKLCPICPVCGLGLYKMEHSIAMV